MFYTYSIKPIVLNTVTLSLACPECQHENQVLTIYKKYLQICWLVMIPLKRNCTLNCPHCGHSSTKKQFIVHLQKLGKDAAAIKERLNSLIKSAKSPLYPKILFCCLALLIAAFVIMAAYNERQSAALVTEYRSHPHDNALLLVKFEEQQYPYEIVFVQEIGNDSAIILPSKHAYKHQTDAKRALEELQKAQINSKFFSNFYDPVVVDTNAFLSNVITHVGVRETKSDDQLMVARKK